MGGQIAGRHPLVCLQEGEPAFGLKTHTDWSHHVLGAGNQRIRGGNSDRLLSHDRTHVNLGSFSHHRTQGFCTHFRIVDTDLHDHIRIFEASIRGRTLLIFIQNVSRDWGKEFSLVDVNLEIEEGEYFVLLGPTAAGKTLLLELIAGFYAPDKGDIWIDGKEATNLPPEDRKVGFVYQDYALFPHLTVKENVEFGLNLKGHPDVRGRAEELLDMLEVSYLAERRPKTLSGGEQQRVAIARALAIEPRVLLLDEPLSALDLRTQEKTRRELKRVQRELGITAIHVTHSQPEALSLGDRIGVMMEGRLVQVGPTRDVFMRPSNRKIADFLGVENILCGRVTSNQKGIATIDLGGDEVQVVTEIEKGAVEVLIRPEDVILSKDLISTSTRNSLACEVVEISQEGVLNRVFLDNDIVALVTQRSLDELKIRPKSKLFATFKASTPHIIHLDELGTK